MASQCNEKKGIEQTRAEVNGYDRAPVRSQKEDAYEYRLERLEINSAPSNIWISSAKYDQMTGTVLCWLRAVLARCENCKGKCLQKSVFSSLCWITTKQIKKTKGEMINGGVQKSTKNEDGRSKAEYEAVSYAQKYGTRAEQEVRSYSDVTNWE